MRRVANPREEREGQKASSCIERNLRIGIHLRRFTQRGKHSPFRYAYELVGCDMPQLIDGSTWPFDFKKVDTLIPSQAEMNAEIVLRDVTAPAPDFINLGE